MVVALLLAAGTFATNVPKMNVHTLSDTKVYVAALTSEQFASELSLLNSRGDIVYYKKSKAAPHLRSLLNLEHLENLEVCDFIRHNHTAATTEYLDVRSAAFI